MTKLEFQNGEKHGGFTFVAYADSLNTDRLRLGYHDGLYGLWRCNSCGTIVPRKNSRIKNEVVKSCGCLGTYNLKAKRRHDDPDNCWKIVHYRLQLRCGRTEKRSRKQIDLAITPQYLKSIYENQDGKCKYTGEPIYPPQRHTRLADFNILSVDRIDSNKGYVEGNIQLVTKQINMMKQCMSHDEFINLCKVVATSS